jgi:homoaconitase/3-isopropylmalate dehydratase large subunit
MSNGKTLFDKIWQAHVVDKVEGGQQIIYIDRHFIHEVTSPQAFDGLRQRGIGLFRKEKITATAANDTSAFAYTRATLKTSGRYFDRKL